MNGLDTVTSTQSRIKMYIFIKWQYGKWNRKQFANIFNVNSHLRNCCMYMLINAIANSNL